MNRQRKHLQHVMLSRFKKDNNVNDTAEICTVYGNNATTITFAIDLRNLELTISI